VIGHVQVCVLSYSKIAVCLSQAVCIFVSDQIMIDVVQVPPGLEIALFLFNHGLVEASVSEDSAAS